MPRNRSAVRTPSSRPAARRSRRPQPAAGSHATAYELLESRVLLSAAFDVTQLTAMRADSNFSSINGQGIGVAVLDTGAFGRNPDLRNNIAAFYDAVEQPISAPIDANPAQDAYDHEGHGSHVSGIAASSNPDIGVAYGAHLVDVRVFPDAGENVVNPDPILAGLEWVAMHATQYNVKVVNMSLGDGTNQNFVPPLDALGSEIKVLEGMGITVVSASGNSYANDPTPGASNPAVESTISAGNTWPTNGLGVHDFNILEGSPNDTFVAVERDAAPDRLSASSQRSTLFNELFAPGTDIFSTWNSDAMLHNLDSGTSMSSPFIAGVVALMQQAAQKFGGRYLDPTTVLNILRNTADDITDYTVTTNGRISLFDPSLTVMDLPETGLTFKRVNVLRAMQGVKQFVQSGGGGTTDLNNTVAKAVVLSPLNGVNTDSQAGNIGTDGLNQPGRADVDLYKFQMNVTGNLFVTLSPVAGGAAFDPRLRIFDSTGSEIANLSGTQAGYPVFSTSVLPIGTYYVGVSADPNASYNPNTGAGAVPGISQGDYQITVTVTPPDRDGVPASSTIADPKSTNTLIPTDVGNLPSIDVTGIVGEDTLPDGTMTPVPNGDVDFYSYTAPDTGVIRIQCDADVRVFDSNNNPVGSEGSNLTLPVTAGHTYFIGVTSQANMGFSPVDVESRPVNSTAFPQLYDLFVAFDNGDRNGTVVQPTSATIGTPVSGVIGSDNGSFLGANAGNKDVDFYSFTAPSAGVFSVSATGTGGLVPEMSLWSTTNGIQGVQRLADAAEASSQLYQQVAAGQTVIVAVTGKGNQNFNGRAVASGNGGQTGSYSISTSLQPLSLLATLSNNSIQNATPTPLALNQPFPGNIGTDSNLVVGPNDVDIYRFTAPDTRDYNFFSNTSTDTSADTVMQVFDASGRILGFSDSTGTSTSDSVTVPVLAGQTVYVGLSPSGQTNYNPLTGGAGPLAAQGTYTLTASDAGPFTRSLQLTSGKKLTYVDAAGHKDTVTLTGAGTGQVTFQGTGNADIFSITLNATDKTSVLNLKGNGTVGDITVNGTMGGILGRGRDLTGNLTVTGGLDRLQLHSATGGKTISIGSGGDLNAQIGQVTDDSITAVEAIKVLKVGQWTDATTPRGTLTAPSVHMLLSTGNFGADVNVGTLDEANIKGALSGSAIRATSSLGNLTLGSVANSEIFAGIRSDLSALPSTPGDFPNRTGSIKSVNVKSKAANAFSNTQIAAANIDKVRIAAIQTANGGTPFGIAADRLNLLKVDNPKQLLKGLFAPLTTPTISLGGDAVLRII